MTHVFSFLCLFLFQMAIILHAHVKLIFAQGSHPACNQACSTVGEITLALCNWCIYGMDFTCMSFLSLTHCIVVDWILLFFKSLHVLLIMFQNRSTCSHRTFTRARNRRLNRGKDLVLSYLDFYYLHNTFTLRSEYRWQPELLHCSCTLTDADDWHNRNSHIVFQCLTPPYHYFKKRMKKPPDISLRFAWDVAFIAIFFPFYVLYGCAKILYIHFRRVAKLYYCISQHLRMPKSFALSTGISGFFKRTRRRSRSAKGKRRHVMQLIKTLAFTTVFATSNDPTAFTNVHDFEIGSVSAVIDNCATATIFNDKSLFVGELMPTK